MELASEFILLSCKVIEPIIFLCVISSVLLSNLAIRINRPGLHLIASKFTVNTYNLFIPYVMIVTMTMFIYQLVAIYHGRYTIDSSFGIILQAVLVVLFNRLEDQSLVILNENMDIFLSRNK